MAKKKASRKVSKKRGNNNSLVIGGVIIVAVLLGFFFFKNMPKTPSTTETPQESAQEAPEGDYALEFLSLENSAEGSVYVVVASKTQDVRTQLPISVEFLKNGQSVWSGTIEGDASVVCRDQTGCGLDGPNFNDLNMGANDILEVVATGSDGTVLVRQSGVTNQP